MLESNLFFEVEGFLNQFDISTLQGMRTTGNTGHSPTSGSDSTPAIAPYRRHQIYRKRRRAERERLEQEVEELKMKLASEPRRQLALAAWKMVAMCQLETRRVSEERQRRLRAAISAQENLIRQYQGVIVGEPIQGTTFDNSGFQHNMLRVESFDTAFYQASAATFDAVYAQVDEVFREIQLDSTDERCGMSVQEGTDSSGKSCAQFTDKRSVPFTFEQSSRFLARTLDAHQENDQQTCDGIQEPDSTVCIKFRVSTKLKTGENASVLLRVMNRRYREEDRMVVVWRTFAEGEGAFSGMHGDETGWGVLTPSSTSKESSILRLYARYASLNVCTVASELVEKKFTGLIVEASTQNSGEIACNLEKLALS